MRAKRGEISKHLHFIRQLSRIRPTLSLHSTDFEIRRPGEIVEGADEAAMIGVTEVGAGERGPALANFRFERRRRRHCYSIVLISSSIPIIPILFVTSPAADSSSTRPTHQTSTDPQEKHTVRAERATTLHLSHGPSDQTQIIPPPTSRDDHYRHKRPGRELVRCCRWDKSRKAQRQFPSFQVFQREGV